jgi:protein tyrosine/serine phosphatase
MKNLKKNIGILLAVLLIMALSCGAYYGYLRLSGNIHTVIPGQVYRSAQLSPSQLQAVIDEHHIKAIIDLAPNFGGHSEELTVAAQNHVAHFDLGLSAYTDPTPSQLKQLDNLIRVAPRPLLIHCGYGVDRTGLASAMALALTPNYPDWKIKLQYSLFYFALSPHSIGKTVMGAYFANLLKQNLPSTPARFQAWVQSQN